MIVNVSEVKELFYDLLESDPEFFNLYGLTKDQCLEIAAARSSKYLKRAITIFKLRCDLTFLLDISSDETTFIEAITEAEADILANLMYELYQKTNFSKLPAQTKTFNGGKFSPHSPASERSSIVTMYNTIKADNNILCDSYSAKDRLTMARRTLDHSGYGEDT